ncbi:MAG: diaminopimelate epimerase [Cryomorphaceae bacterium]|nr:MAG: diaminopimelate epimerase [Cryomorphaceae bacterium]
MKLSFSKYQGNGNDFIIIDGINNSLTGINHEKIQTLCDRRKGIGADGFIIIKSNLDSDFEMVYYNSDGKIGSFCGNGARCAYDFSIKSGISRNISKFKAYDGFHTASFKGEKISISINKVNNFKKIGLNYFVNTGSPHLVKFDQDLEKLKIEDEFIKSQSIKLFKDDGVNVNFVSKKNNNTFLARTFERGVNAETLSCGTGAVAIAISAKLRYNFQDKWVNVVTKGGDLSVTFKKDNEMFNDIFLVGDAKHVFDGKFSL